MLNRAVAIEERTDEGNRPQNDGVDPDERRQDEI